MQPQTLPRPLEWSAIIHHLRRALAEAPPVYLVGGTVRDALRDAPFKDIDLATAADGRAIARQIANDFDGDYFAMDHQRQVGRALVTYQGEDYTIDVTTFTGPDLQSDLAGRDFTINAMAAHLQSDLRGIIDPLGGMADWWARVLRRCGPQSIPSDPVRALRAVRLSLDYGLSIEPNTRADLHLPPGALAAATSAERLRDAFFDVLRTPKPASGFMLLRHLGLLEEFLPELADLPPDAWRALMTRIDKLNTLMTVISPRRDDNIAANAEFGTFVYLLDRYRQQLQAYLATPYPEDRTQRELLLLGAALQETSLKPKTLAGRLALSRDEAQHMTALWQGAEVVAGWQAGPLPDARTVYRFWDTLGTYGALLFVLADYLADQGLYLQMPAWTAYLQVFETVLAGESAAREADPLVDGRELMAHFGLQPGPLVGDLIDALREAHALGKIHTPDEALARAEQWLTQMK